MVRREREGVFTVACQYRSYPQSRRHGFRRGLRAWTKRPRRYHLPSRAEAVAPANSAAKAHFRDIPSLGLLVEQADLILSILVPAQAVSVAELVAAAMRLTGKHAVYPDCNAVSPQTTRRIEAVITGAGGQYVDGGIIGGSPTRGTPPRFYVSGEHAHVVAELDGKGITVKPSRRRNRQGIRHQDVLRRPHQSTSTFRPRCSSAAEAMNLNDELVAEFEFSQPAALKQMSGGISAFPPTRTAGLAKWRK